MEHDERAYSAHWEKLADELTGERLEQQVAKKSLLVPTMYAPAYRQGLEDHYKKQKLVGDEAAGRQESRDDEALRIAKETLDATRTGNTIQMWVLAVLGLTLMVAITTCSNG